MTFIGAIQRALLTVILMTAPAFADAYPEGVAKIDTQEVDRRIHDLMTHPEMTGLSVAIIENGDLVFAKGYGETLRGSGDKVTADTVFRWASLSKSVAAAAVLDLTKEGHFGLNSPAQAHAASLTLPPSENITTIEDVLSHGTGITRNAYDRRIEGGQMPKTIRRALKGLPRLCEPGECHTYQNVAFDASTEMIETATGIPYKAAISERFFKPLKMETATLTRAGLLNAKHWAKPHNRKGLPISDVKPTYYRMPGAAGVNSSVKDLAKWMLAHMTPGLNTLSPNMLAQLHAPHIATPRENRRMQRNFFVLQNAHYGLGWRTYNFEGRRVVGHRGAVSGYRALMLYDPDLKTGVALMWNSSYGRPVGLQLEIMDQVYGNPKRDWMRLSSKIR